MHVRTVPELIFSRSKSGTVDVKISSSSSSWRMALTSGDRRSAKQAPSMDLET
jgi:hypothetical protein